MPSFITQQRTKPTENKLMCHYWNRTPDVWGAQRMILNQECFYHSATLKSIENNFMSLLKPSVWINHSTKNAFTIYSATNEIGWKYIITSCYYWNPMCELTTQRRMLIHCTTWQQIKSVENINLCVIIETRCVSYGKMQSIAEQFCYNVKQLRNSTHLYFNKCAFNVKFRQIRLDRTCNSKITTIIEIWLI